MKTANSTEENWPFFDLGCTIVASANFQPLPSRMVDLAYKQRGIYPKFCVAMSKVNFGYLASDLFNKRMFHGT